MKYFKRCPVGHMNIYDNQGEAPISCTTCNRNIIFIPEKEYDPQTAEAPEAVIENTDENNGDGQTDKKKSSGFVLVAENGDKLYFDKEVIVGRNSELSDYLASFPEVSREHFSIKPRSSNIAATITDISRYGTSVNGTELTKGKPVPINDGSEITLVNRAKIVLKIEG